MTALISLAITPTWKEQWKILHFHFAGAKLEGHGEEKKFKSVQATARAVLLQSGSFIPVFGMEQAPQPSWKQTLHSSVPLGP